MSNVVLVLYFDINCRLHENLNIVFLPRVQFRKVMEYYIFGMGRILGIPTVIDY